MRHTLIACFIILLAGTAQAATIKVLCDGPLEPALVGVGDAFKTRTGHNVEFTFAPSPVIHKRITDGEVADVVIVQPNFLAELAAKGKVDPGDHPSFARIGVGIAARVDAPSRDIKTPDALKQVLLRADTIVFNNVASGNQFARVLERLGIAEDVKAKVVRTEPRGTFERIRAGSGDDLAVGTLTQIRADKRLKLIGALPPELQSYLQYAAVPMTGAPDMKAAVEFVRFLFTPAVKAQLTAAGRLDRLGARTELAFNCNRDNKSEGGITMAQPAVFTRRRTLAAAGVLIASGVVRPALAQALIRQGYQTNLWGMPTYYLLRSGLLEKRGIKFEEFAVPSGNLTMQQMVARQVDLGTYAGPSLILGHDKGGLVAIAQIEHVGKTASVMARKDLNITKVEQLKGLKIANQTGSSVGNIFVDQIAPAAGLKKGDYQEVRMNVNDMIAALAAKTVDVMVNVEPYNAIAEADGLATKVMNYWSVDKMPVFMAATPDFVSKNPDTVVAYLKAWLDAARDFKDNPTKVADAIYSFFTSKGYSMSQDTFRKAMATVDVDPGFPNDLKPYMQQQAEVLLKEKKIAAIPDWSKALRPDFMEKAKAGA